MSVFEVTILISIVAFIFAFAFVVVYLRYLREIGDMHYKQIMRNAEEILNDKQTIIKLAYQNSALSEEQTVMKVEICALRAKVQKLTPEV